MLKFLSVDTSKFHNSPEHFPAVELPLPTKLHRQLLLTGTSSPSGVRNMFQGA